MVSVLYRERGKGMKTWHEYQHLQELYNHSCAALPLFYLSLILVYRLNTQKFVFLILLSFVWINVRQQNEKLNVRFVWFNAGWVEKVTESFSVSLFVLIRRKWLVLFGPVVLRIINLYSQCLFIETPNIHKNYWGLYSMAPPRGVPRPPWYNHWPPLASFISKYSFENVDCTCISLYTSDN